MKPEGNLHRGLTPSILDLLSPPGPGATNTWEGYGIEQATDTVRRDLEDLLNTHQSWDRLPEGMVELANSVFTYGLPDPSLFAEMGLQRSDRIGIVEEITRRFEPRLSDIRVRVADLTEVRRGRMRFHIDAKLCIEPAPEVAFETVLDLASGHSTLISRGVS